MLGNRVGVSQKGALLMLGPEEVKPGGWGPRLGCACDIRLEYGQEALETLPARDYL